MKRSKKLTLQSLKVTSFVTAANKKLTGGAPVATVDPVQATCMANDQCSGIGSGAPCPGSGTGGSGKDTVIGCDTLDITCPA